MDTEMIIKKTWGQGFVTIGSVTRDSCRYVAEYISKGMMSGTTVKQLKLYCKEPPFALMSQGIGAAYVAANEDQLRRDLGVRVRGKSVGLPRYYRKVLGLTTEDLAPKAREVQAKKLKQLEKEVHGHEDAIFPRVVSARKQTINNIVAKSR